MDNTLQDNDIIFRSDLLKTILSRAGSYIIGILSAYLLPYLFQEGFSGILDSITWDTIKQVAISIIIVLLAEAGLRYLFYEISRLRANSDLRDKAIILPKGVKLKDVLPFTVADYKITYRYSHNGSGGLNLTREESATVLGGNYVMQRFKFDLHDSFPKFTKDDIKDPQKTSIRFETLPKSNLGMTSAGWDENNNSLFYVIGLDDTIGPDNENKLIYALNVDATNYISSTAINSESEEHVSEKVVLEIKDITIEIEFPDDINVSDLDFEARGKSNVLLKSLASVIKDNNNFKTSVGKSRYSITINSPVPDVRYGFTWKWEKPLT